MLSLSIALSLFSLIVLSSSQVQAAATPSSSSSTSSLPHTVSFLQDKSVSHKHKSLPLSASVSFQPSTHRFYSHNSNTIMSIRGGSVGSGVSSGSTVDAVAEGGKPNSIRNHFKRNIIGLWGVFQVVSILANAIKRLVPVALIPFQQNDLQPVHWVMYVVWCIVMAYSEGYKAFQLKFSPMVVSRAFDLVDKPSFLNLLLSGPYCMGMFNASRKRMIVSWCITAGVFSLVKLVKFLPYPYRSIVDAGVVVGLSYGTLSIVVLTVKALFGGKVVDNSEKEV